METENKNKMQNIIKRYVNVPEKFKINVEVEKKDDYDKTNKIMRRYDDLTKNK